MALNERLYIQINAPPTGVAEDAQAVVVGDEVSEGGDHAQIIAYGARQNIRLSSESSHFREVAETAVISQEQTLRFHWEGTVHRITNGLFF